MAAYAGLLSLAQTTDLNSNQRRNLFSIQEREKIRSIHEYVIFLLSFLEDFPEKAIRWESKIRDVAYHTEDIIEVFMWQRIKSRDGEMNPSSMKLEYQLKDAMEKIGLIAGEVMDERPAAISSSSRLARTANDARVIGLDHDVMAIKDRLCGLSSNLQVIPVVGMGGIGKTTLARTLYNDPLIIDRFEIRAWVSVSQDYRPHKILLGLAHSMNLLEKLQKCGNEIDACEIALKVFKNLKGRRYLVIMDDVWGTKVWDDVRNVFPDDSNGSRIMLTTRLLDVAAYPQPNSPLHEMQFMDDSQCWDLLKEKVFTNCNCPLDLEDVGKEIARSCAGLPLVVVLVAGVLSAVNKTRTSWEEIARTISPIVGGKSEDILSLSYIHLPHHLRPCFLFIGGFPEDEDIHASRLIKLWVAEGFLKHKNGRGKCLEEEAEEYLEDLVKRNLVIVNSRKINGKIKTCSLHDIVRDLCIRKLHEEKFVCVMDEHVLPHGYDMMINARHISFNWSDIYNIWGLMSIRTILCFKLQYFPGWLACLGRFKLLRVLDDDGDRHEELPSQVFELYHLRYLALIYSSEIPSAISNLVNLQTLIIRPNFRGQKRYWRHDKHAPHFSLPLEIWSLHQLRHIVLYDLYTLPHPPEGTNLPLQNLQTLWLVENLVWDEKILQMIPNVKELGLVYTNINEDYHLHLLKHLHQLEKLEVNVCWDFSLWGQNLTFPLALKKLTLVGGGYPWEDMDIIGSLPNLQVLKLLDYACDGETWETADEEFPQLKFLLIDTSNLRQWITESSHFPRLKWLVFHACWDLREIPEGIGQISTLELIELECCNSSVVESAKQINEDQKSYGNYALQVRVQVNSNRFFH